MSNFKFIKMNKTFFLTGCLITFSLSSIAQTMINLTFSGTNDSSYVQLDSIKVMNLSVECDTTLYWPDTVLTIGFAGIENHLEANNCFEITQSFSNPTNDVTGFSVILPEMGILSLRISDLLGREVNGFNQYLTAGRHKFSFTPGMENLYIVCAEFEGLTASMKIINLNMRGSNYSVLDYQGAESKNTVKNTKADRPEYCFDLGHKLLMIGFTGGNESGISDYLYNDESFTFQFAFNIPCPGMPEITYEGQVYHTVQIYNQCWLKENLNLGTIIPTINEMSNDGIVEKYCYLDQPDSCIKYGGLYQWQEAMQYSWKENTRGICPPGWHIPGDLDWKILEGATDSQYGIGDPVWDVAEARGFDVGLNIKSASGWILNGNGTDMFGFAALPAGYRSLTGGSQNATSGAYWISSKYITYETAIKRNLFYFANDITRHEGSLLNGSSVRCLKDN